MQSLCYENQFLLILKDELIIITKIFAIRFTLKKRQRGTQKWSIDFSILPLECSKLLGLLNQDFLGALLSTLSLHIEYWYSFIYY